MTDPGGQGSPPEEGAHRVTSLLPIIPEELELDPLVAALLTTAAFLDLAEEDELRPDPARQVLERVGLYVQRLDDDDIDGLAAELERLGEYAKQAKWPDEACEFIDEFLSYCGFPPEDEPEAER